MLFGRSSGHGPGTSALHRAAWHFGEDNFFHLPRLELCVSVSITELRVNLKHHSGGFKMALH